MIHLILLITGIMITIIVLNFKRQKKKYLPISTNGMTQEQELYVITMIKKYEISCFNKGVLVTGGTDEIIYKIRNKELSNREIEKLNKFLLNRTIEIGIFKFK